MAATLLTRGISVSLGDRLVLDDVDVTVAPGVRIGVVAPNGTGKTTLLRVLAGCLTPDAGTVRLAPPNATVGYLPQEVERRPGETVLAFLARRTGVAAATAELEHATTAVSTGHEAAADRYGDALDRWLGLGGADLDTRIVPVWADLGLDPPLLELPMTSLSGGQGARVSLAAVLLAQYDVFLLDEPTNDLDFAGLDHLERFLARLQGGAVIVSHDRAFLERTITSVLEIDERKHQGRAFAGGWLAYLDERETARRHAEQSYADYRAKRDDLQTRARQQRQWAVQGVRKATKQPRDNDKAQRDFFLNRTEKQAAKVRITEKALDRLDVVDKPWEGWELRLSIAAAPRSGDLVARLDGAVVRRGTFTLGPVDIEVGWAERVAVLGPNGSGKTTLLGALLGRVPIDEGEQRLGPSVVIGEVDQARRRLSGDETVLDAFQRAAAIARQNEARSVLAKVGLDAEAVTRRADSLSPGERTRAVLALLMAMGVNCLVLDEPTNHLDLPAIEQLEQALSTYDGTLLLVTHDRRLLEAVETDRTITLDDGRIVSDSVSDDSVLGRDVRHPLEQLETFPAPDTCTRVRFTSDELTSLCPITGQPDFSSIEIDYAPNERCIESKSLKLYLWSFRDKAAFCEQLAADIAAEVQRATHPTSIRVTVTQHTRGGIVTEATAELP